MCKQQVKPNNQSKIMFILAYWPPNGDVSQLICNLSPLLNAATSNLKKVDGEVRHMHNCKHTAWAAAKRTNNV